MDIQIAVNLTMAESAIAIADQETEGAGQRPRRVGQRTDDLDERDQVANHSMHCDPRVVVLDSNKCAAQGSFINSPRLSTIHFLRPGISPARAAASFRAATPEHAS